MFNFNAKFHYFMCTVHVSDVLSTVNKMSLSSKNSTKFGCLRDKAFHKILSSYKGRVAWKRNFEILAVCIIKIVENSDTFHLQTCRSSKLVLTKCLQNWLIFKRFLRVSFAPSVTDGTWEVLLMRGPSHGSPKVYLTNNVSLFAPCSRPKMSGLFSEIALLGFKVHQHTLCAFTIQFSVHTVHCMPKWEYVMTAH